MGILKGQRGCDLTHRQGSGPDPGDSLILHLSFPRTPAMIGCSFVVDREYFGDIGLLDPGMEVYGAENIELGMRVSRHRLACSGEPALSTREGLGAPAAWKTALAQPRQRPSGSPC